MSRLVFPRIARQLNYQRTMLSPVTARVDIPGLPYEAFDQSGAKVQPWSLLRLFESVRACTFWDYRKTGESLADFHVLLRDHFFFVVGAKLTIHNNFYKEDEPKFPLFVNASLEHVGKSSKCMSYRLFHPDNENEYATCIVNDVLVYSGDRKPVPYPDWWMKKFAHLCKEKPTKKNEMLKAQFAVSNSSSYQVNLTDIDTYKHTNWTAYVKYFYESVYKHVLDNNYKDITQHHINGGVKSFHINYISESNLYDKLNILTCEDGESENRVYGEVSKEDGTLCVQVMMDFYNKEYESKL